MNKLLRFLNNEFEFSQTNQRRINLALQIIVVFAAIIAFVSCCAIPPITGQFCLDFMSGHVPKGAEEIFLRRIFLANQQQDYVWLQTVTTPEALSNLKASSSKIIQSYKVTSEDDLAGLYERTILFENGTRANLSYFSRWGECPDFSVTESEVFEKMQLSYFRLESD